MILLMKLRSANASNLAVVSGALEGAKLAWAALSPAIRQSAEGLAIGLRIEAASIEIEVLRRSMFNGATLVTTPRLRAGAWQLFG